MSKKQKVLPFWDEIFFDRTILNQLIQFLPPISVMSLVRAFPLCRSKLYGSVYDVIKKRFILPEAFRDFCEEYTLTGGSLLEFLLGEDYNCSDWDYCTQYLPLWSRLPQYQNPGNAPYWKCLNIRIHLCLGSYLHSKIISDVYNCTHLDEEKVVQVIHLKESIEKYVAEFDLDFCKNYLSGNKLVVMNPISVLHKKCKLDLYKTHFPKTRNLDHILFSALPKKYQRLEKYAKRGFDIEISQRENWKELCAKVITHDVSSNIELGTYEKMQYDIRHIGQHIMRENYDDVISRLPEWIQKHINITKKAIDNINNICLAWFTFWEHRIENNNRLALGQICPSLRDERTFKKKFN